MHKHPSHLGMQLNVLFIKTFVQLCKFIVSSSTCSVVMSKWWWERVQKSWKPGAKTEGKTGGQNAATTPWSAWWDRWVRKKGAAAKKKQMAILPSVRCSKPRSLPWTLSTIASHLYTTHTLSHMADHPKEHITMPTNGNAHVKVIEMCAWGIHYDTYT